MEKVLTGIVTIALTLSMGAASGFTGAYTNEVKTGFSQTAGSQAVRYDTPACRYIDADGNGFCDNCRLAHTGANTSCTGFADTNNDGICDNCNNHHAGANTSCTGYVDNNGDGICDNHAAGEHCPYSTNHDTWSCPNNSVNSNNTGTSNGGHHGRHHGRHH